MAERAKPVPTARFLSVYLPAAQKQDKTREQVIEELGMNPDSFNSRLSQVRNEFRKHYNKELPALKGSTGGGGKKTDWSAIDALVAEQLGIAPVDTSTPADGENTDTEGGDEAVDES